MTDDNGDDVQKYKITFCDKCGHTDLSNQLHKDIWNRAIEKAAKIAERIAAIIVADEIRKLKL